MGGDGQGASNPAGTGTPTVEELTAKLAESEKQRESLAESVRGLTPYKEETERLRARNTELEAGRGGGDGRGGDDEPFITRAQATEIGRGVAREEIKSHVEEQDRISTEEAKKNLAFARERKKWLGKAETDFPTVKDAEGELAKLATQIFEDPASGLSVKKKNILDEDVFMPAHASAEYDAVSRADKQLQAKGAAAADAGAGARFAGAGGSGGGAGPQGGQAGELSDEEYNKLSPEQKEAYKDRRFAERNK